MLLKEMAYNKKALKQGLSFARAIASEDTCIFWTKISTKVTNRPLPSSHGSVPKLPRNNGAKCEVAFMRIKN